MNVLKFIIYVGVFILLISNNLSEDERMLLFYAYLAFIYFDCKDINIRSLVVILAVLEFVFFEIDYFVYIVSKYYLNTGAVAGNLILDIVVLIFLVSLIISIFYRCEIMEYFSNSSLEYLPTRADIMQIYVVRIVLFVHVIFFLVNAYMVYELNLVNNNPDLFDKISQELIEYGHMYVSAAEKVEFFRYFAIVIVLSPWSKKPIEKTEITLSV